MASKVKLNANRDEIVKALGLSNRGRPPYIPQDHNEVRSASSIASNLTKMLESPAVTAGERQQLERIILVKERGVQLYNQLKELGYKPSDIRRFTTDNGDN